MRRDGIVPKPPKGVGERAWWLEQVLARTPLGAWTGGAPAEFLALLVPEDWGPVLLRGLSQAAIATRDGAWAGPLLDYAIQQPWTGRRFDDAEVLDALVATVPERQLAERAAALLRRDPSGADGLDGLLARCPRPWQPSLVDAALAALAEPLHRLGNGYRLTHLCRLLALRLPVDAADRAAEVAALVRRRAVSLQGMSGSELTEWANDGADHPTGPPERPADYAAAQAQARLGFTLARDIDLVTDVLRFRHDLLEELA
jgi:hypothetical protein